MSLQPAARRHHTVSVSTVLSLIGHVEPSTDAVTSFDEACRARASAADTAGVPIDAELIFNSRDPFAVKIVFTFPAAPAVEWVFARELLVAGLRAPAGSGDVHLFPYAGGVVLELSSPSGRARMSADLVVLADFVRDCLDVVPFGAEHEFFDLDFEIALIVDFELPGTAQV